MRKTWYNSFWTLFLAGFLLSCGNSTVTDAAPSKNEAKEPVPVETTHVSAPPGKYSDLLKKFEPISFDTLKVYYSYNGKRFEGKELTLKEAKIFPLGISENYFGRLSGMYACYQFEIDSETLGLIARTPSEYESSSIKLFLFDLKKDSFSKEYVELSQDIGDAGDYYHRTSWLFRTNKKEIHSLVYDYSSYNNEVDDTSNHTIDEWRSYFVINCMSAKFDTISKNEAQLKKRFKRLLKTEE